MKMEFRSYHFSDDTLKASQGQSNYYPFSYPEFAAGSLAHLSPGKGIISHDRTGYCDNEISEEFFSGIM